MSTLKKIIYWLAGAVITILLLLNYLAPILINSELLKGRIEGIVSARINGSVTFEEIDLSLLPRPHAVIRQGRMTSETGRGTLESLTVYPEIAPLFSGELKLSELRVTSPAISVSLPEEQEDVRAADPPAARIKEWALLFAPLALNVEEAVIEIDNGNLELLRQGKPVVSLAELYARVTVSPAGSNRFRTRIQGSVSEMTVHRGDAELTVKNADIRGKLYYDKDKTSILLSEFHSDGPPLELAGELSMDNRSGLIKLSLTGKELDVYSTREAALAIAGDIPVVQDIFRILQGGRIPFISYLSEGRSFADLGRTNNMVIKGSMERGRIFVPGAELDLAQIHSLLERLVDNKSFVDELSLINDPRGTALGRLVLGESLNSINARVEASNINLSTDYERIPYPLEINTGNFYYDETGIRIEDLRVKAGRSSLSDMKLEINLQKEPFLEVSSGTAEIFMDETYSWISDLMDLPDISLIRSPMSLSHINIVWDKHKEKAVKGGITIKNGPGISFGISGDEEELKISRLTVKDDESHAVSDLNFKGNEIFIKFTGNLTHSTIDKIISDNTVLKGSIKGDFHALTVRDKPYRFAAQGSLEASDITLPLDTKESVNINSISLDAAENKIKIVASDITLGKSHFNLKGDINASDDEFIINMDLSTDELEWDKLKNTFRPEKDDRNSGAFYDFPVRVVIRFNAETFIYDKYVVKPFHADISLDPENIKVDVTKSDICGISFPGNLQLTPQDMSLDFQPLALYRNVETSMECLFGVSRRMTGNYNLKAKVTSKGKSEDLLQSLKGDLEIEARNGRIYRGGILARILAFINVTEIFRGQAPDLVKEGFAYKSFTADGEFYGETLTLTKAVLDASTMSMVGQGHINMKDKKVDLDILVAPLKTADFIIKKIPVLRDITGGTLVSIPIKVTGDIEDPKIVYLPVSAVGAGLLNIMNNTIEAPVKVLEPIINK